jgi:pyruvate/2-oxoglutarate dehydrogenase complex dihydrolipoamide acyltransferase (E2) component
VAAALRPHPRANASWIEDNIVANEHVNVGLAVATAEARIVPVIHDADRLSLAEISARRCAKRAC